MRVFGAYIHHDEIGTVHMHLDYVPFSVDNKRGLETRVSNDKAIEQMGYRNWTDWKDRQFETLEKICHEHNIERVNMNNHSRHISVESYKKEQRMIESLQNDLEHTLKSQDLPVVEPIKPRVNRITKKENRSVRRIFSSSRAQQRAKRQNKYIRKTNCTPKSSNLLSDGRKRKIQANIPKHQEKVLYRRKRTFRGVFRET